MAHDGCDVASVVVASASADRNAPVSYTHLTLPTSEHM